MDEKKVSSAIQIIDFVLTEEEKRRHVH
jgi:hypothetical protein